jgi:hypothetical protein
MYFSSAQLDKLSDLVLDLAKGLFLASIAVPAVTNQATFLDSIRSTLVGIFLTCLSLTFVKLKENKK